MKQKKNLIFHSISPHKSHLKWASANMAWRRRWAAPELVQPNFWFFCSRATKVGKRPKHHFWGSLKWRWKKKCVSHLANPLTKLSHLSPQAVLIAVILRKRRTIKKNMQSKRSLLKRRCDIYANMSLATFVWYQFRGFSGRVGII